MLTGSLVALVVVLVLLGSAIAARLGAIAAELFQLRRAILDVDVVATSARQRERIAEAVAGMQDAIEEFQDERRERAEERQERRAAAKREEEFAELNPMLTRASPDGSTWLSRLVRESLQTELARLNAITDPEAYVVTQRREVTEWQEAVEELSGFNLDSIQQERNRIANGVANPEEYRDGKRRELEKSLATQTMRHSPEQLQRIQEHLDEIVASTDSGTYLKGRLAKLERLLEVGRARPYSQQWVDELKAVTDASAYLQEKRESATWRLEEVELEDHSRALRLQARADALAAARQHRSKLMTEERS